MLRTDSKTFIKKLTDGLDLSFFVLFYAILLLVYSAFC